MVAPSRAIAGMHGSCILCSFSAAGSDLLLIWEMAEYGRMVAAGDPRRRW
jgi:hypothetical protein